MASPLKITGAHLPAKISPPKSTDQNCPDRSAASSVPPARCCVPVLKQAHATPPRLRCVCRICKTGLGSLTMVLHFLIQGRVQGVGFRWFVHREASELDLHGWVRNTEEGDVEVVASGTADDLVELRAALRRGPRGSRVDRLIEHYLDEKEAAGLNAFRIEGAW
jgi:acylphosphatase